MMVDEEKKAAEAEEPEAKDGKDKDAKEYRYGDPVDWKTETEDETYVN